MICPYCGQTIPNIPGYLYLCPFCHTPLTDRLDEKLVPLKDKTGQPVTRYYPSQNHTEQKGILNYIEYENKIKKQKNDNTSLKQINKILLVVCILVLIENIIARVVTEFAVIAVLFIIKTIISSLSKTPPQNLEAKALFDNCKNQTIPIAFYGNTNVFGYAAVYADCNAHDEFPQIMRHEFLKKDLVEIKEYPDDTVHVSYYDINRRLQTFILPTFREIEELKQLLGLGERKESVTFPQNPSTRIH